MADRIGELLVRENLISLVQLKRAQADQRTTGKRLSYSLARLGILGERELADFLSEQYSVPWMNLTNFEIDPKVIGLVPKAIASKHSAIPVQRAGSTLLVAMADPSNIYAIDDIKFITNLNVEPVVSTEGAIEDAIARFYDRSGAGPVYQDMLGSLSLERVDAAPLERATPTASPGLPESEQAVKLCNRVLLHAASRAATQVHVEPSDSGLRVRYRIDGVLHPETELPVGLRSAVVTRFKLMAGLEVAERRMPQEGAIRGFRVKDREIAVRVATMPTAAGETLVLRLQDREQVAHDLEELGLAQPALRELRAALHRRHGLVLVAAPAGHGATTTLYAMLAELNRDSVSIVTLEDPVEFPLPGCTQIHVGQAGGPTFAEGVVATMRLDPDIIMLGALPEQAAQVTMQAALSSHRVLTTLATHDAAAALERMVHLGVEPFVVGAAVALVVAQRLVRRLCGECAEPDVGATVQRLIDAGMTAGRAKDCRPKRAKGCKACLGGYRGRVALFEVLPIGAELRARLLAGADAAELRTEMARLGVPSLRQVGLTRVADGELGLDDVLHATSE